MRRSLLASSACAVALALGACGGGGGGEAEELTAAQYRAQAKQICTEADRATQRVQQPTRATPQAIADYLRQLLAPNDRATQRFQQLDPPAELQDAHDDALRANRRGSEEVKRLVQRLENGDDPREVLAGAQERIRSLTREANAAAGRLGVPECGDSEA